MRYGLLSPLPVPDKPFQSITMDFIVSLPVSGKQKYDAILTVVDRLSKFCLLFPCHTDITGLETARLLHSHVFNRYGFPEVIVSDRDPKFTSAFYTEWCRILRIRQNLSTAFHPETDGQSERFNRTLQQVLRCYCSEDHCCWSQMYYQRLNLQLMQRQIRQLRLLLSWLCLALCHLVRWTLN